jgi:hypothetical protein
MSTRLQMIADHLSPPNANPAGDRKMGLEDRMIARAKEVEGYINPIAYDEQHLGQYGYFVCKTCKQLWAGTDASYDDVNVFRCLARRVDKPIGLEQVSFSVSKDIVYVMGPNDNGVLLNFHKISFAQLKSWGAINTDKLNISTDWKGRVLAVIKPKL